MSASTKKRRILFFTPYASRTGSEMLIYYILKYFDRSKYEAGLVCFARGELIDDIPSDVKVFVTTQKFSFVQKVAYHLGWHPTHKFLEKIARRFKADVWYANTVMLPEVVQIAHKLEIPVVTNVQELSSVYTLVSQRDFEALVTKSDLLIGCSEIVCQCLRESGGKQVERLYNFVDTQSVQPDAVRVKEIRAEWGAAPDDFVWIMSGTSSERKGFDLFPDIGMQFPKGSKVHMVWVGKLIDDGLTYWTVQRCKTVENVKIHIIGAKKEDYYSYMAAADGFILTSRQEPFGMVLVEAALLGKPIVSFESGGPTEFITPEMGRLVPNLDIPLFAKTMQEVAQNREKFDSSKAKKAADQYSAETGVNNWQLIMDRFFERQSLS